MLEQEPSEGYAVIFSFVVLLVLVAVELLIAHATGALLRKPPARQSIAS